MAIYPKKHKTLVPEYGILGLHSTHHPKIATVRPAAAIRTVHVIGSWANG